MNVVARYFTGEYKHTVDSVNRLVIPARWRTGESEELFLFGREEGRVSVLPKSEIEKILRQIDSAIHKSELEKRAERQSLFSSARQVPCDRQGRITLDADLMRFARLKDEVILVGGGERFEIWDPKAWMRRKAELNPKLNATLDEFGI